MISTNRPLSFAIHGVTVLLALFSVLLLAQSVRAAQIDIPGPKGSGAFGTQVVVLPNGNIVITDRAASPKPGAVYLYSPAGDLISGLTGSSGSNDQIGSRGITVLKNGNFVISSPRWRNGDAANAGAVTWIDGNTGLSGTISAANSLVGTRAEDLVGLYGVTPLSNGNYVVGSPSWSNGASANAGAVTWADGTTGLSGAVSEANSVVGNAPGDSIGGDGVVAISNGNYVIASAGWHNTSGALTWVNGSSGLSGVVSASNSLVGTTPGDYVGYYRVKALGNGNYVTFAPFWHNGAAQDAGAVTWINGNTGLTGVVSANNSLVGTSAGDTVGIVGVTVLSNGNYVVCSPGWHNGANVDAGAVTWANGVSGLSGAVSAANSIVGVQAQDSVGAGVTALANGNYVVQSPNWKNGVTGNVGAVTWVDGSAGSSAIVSADNSLIGTAYGDYVGSDGVTALSNGNYVIASSNWHNGPLFAAGAVTWADGKKRLSGTVSSANSLVGTSEGESLGFSEIRPAVIALSNGNYFVRNPNWRNGANANAGAVTWANGATGLSGAVSAANSLVGTMTDDSVGDTGVVKIGNGNYVVLSPLWNSATQPDVGAVTWVNGSSGLSGPVSAANSLVGTSAYDSVGYAGALSNGNYVVVSASWSSSTASHVGAVTWVNGSSGLSGAVSAANSLIGTTTNDFVGRNGMIELSNGNYVVASSNWSNGAATSVGAVTWANGTTGLSGAVSAANSLVGSTTSDLVGNNVVMPLSNGNYAVASLAWNNGVNAMAGAISQGRGYGRTAAPILATNSVRGTSAGGGAGMVFDYDATRDQLVVGQPASNLVSIFKADTLFVSGLE